MRRALAAAAALLPLAAPGLEPRYDHRDAHGPVVEVLGAFDSVSLPDRTATAWRPAVRAGWSVDVRGDGNELLVCADAALRGWSDPSRERVLATASARYRSTFGTEQWKTYFDAGLWVPVRSRLAAGPLVGLGLIHDFSQDWGAFVGGEFGAAWGEARIASFSLAAGLQLRFALP